MTIGSLHGTIRHMPNPKEGTPQPNPFKVAEQQFENALQTGDFNVGEVRGAIDRVQNVGFSTGMKPESLYKKLESLAKKAATKAKTTGSTSESDFRDLEKGLHTAAENFSLKVKPPKPT